MSFIPGYRTSTSVCGALVYSGSVGVEVRERGDTEMVSTEGVGPVVGVSGTPDSRRLFFIIVT